MPQSSSENVEKASRSLKLDQICKRGGEQPRAIKEGGLRTKEYDEG